MVANAANESRGKTDEQQVRLLTRLGVEVVIPADTGCCGALTHHLGYEKGDRAGRGSGNSFNGTTPKTLKTDLGEVRVEMPRDRNSTFEPKIVEKGQTHWDGFDERIDAVDDVEDWLTVEDAPQVGGGLRH